MLSQHQIITDNEWDKYGCDLPKQDKTFYVIRLLALTSAEQSLTQRTGALRHWFHQSPGGTVTPSKALICTSKNEGSWPQSDVLSLIRTKACWTPPGEAATR